MKRYIDADLLRKEIDKWVEAMADAIGDYSDGVRFAFFPELRESDDERIRKEIISALKFANDGGVYDKHIAYLEKQKERSHFVMQVLSDGRMKKAIEIYSDECDCKAGDVVKASIRKKD